MTGSDSRLSFLSVFRRAFVSDDDMLPVFPDSLCSTPNDTERVMNDQQNNIRKLNDRHSEMQAEFRQLSETLAGERAVMKAVFDSSTDIVAVKDRNFVYRSVNTAFCSFLGMEKQDIIGKTDEDLFPPGEAALYHRSDAGVMESLLPEKGDWFVQGRTGRVWLHIVKNPVPDPEGKAAGLVFSARDVSGAMKAEIELDRFFSLVPDMVCLASADGYFKKINSAWERVLGYTAEELLAVPYISFIHPDDRSKTLDEVQRQMTGGRVVCFINRYRTKEGTYRWLEWNALPPEGDTIFAVARDVTERIDAEREPRLWADAFRYCAHGIAVGVPSGDRIMTCNPAFAAMHGMTIEEVAGTPILQMYPEEEHDKIRRCIAEAKQKHYIRFETKRLKKDRSAFAVQMDLVIVIDELRNPLYYIATVQDITERKQVESALRESETGFRSVVESAPEAIVIQTDGRLAYVNPAAVKLYGVEDASVLTGRKILDLIHPDYHESVARRIRLMKEDGAGIAMTELRHLRLDGSEITVEVVSVPFTYRGRNGSMLFIRDITERKKAEDERKALESQLFQAQKMESIGRLAGGVAHDLNNLLTPVLGYSEMLIEQFARDARHLSQIKVIHHAGVRARDLVRQLLAFGRRQELEFRILDLNVIVRDFEHLLRRTVRENIDIRYRLFPDVLGIQGDIGQLEQIIMNLAVNAQDAMPDGGVLTIETAALDTGAEQERCFDGIQPGFYAVLTVSDTGTGMDKATADRIFEPFFTTKETGRGTGLGLATVYGIVRQHG
jgi:PAS domain S-box-containing protein